MMEPFVSVAIPTYNRPAYLMDALLGVINQQTDFSFEALVVDNGCDDGLAARVQETARCAAIPVRYLAVPEIGLHNCRHAAAFAARGEIIVYVDDDVLTPPGWLAAMIAPFVEPQVAIVGGKTLPLWEAPPPEWLELFGGNGGTFLSLLDLGESRLELSWPGGVFGCNMAVRRSAIFQVGGFNPDGIGDRRHIWLRGDGETGLHCKVFAANWRVIYQPDAWLYHRIPPERLRPEYFCWRAFLQGISDSYSEIRQHQPSSLRLVRRAGRDLYRAGVAYCRFLLYGKKAVRLRVEASYWSGKGQHRLRVACNQKLRQHVQCHSYLDVATHQFSEQ